MAQCKCSYICKYEMHRNDGVDGLPAFILAAPGQDEEKAKRPAAGDTGLMLNRILASLNSLLPNAFPSVCRYQYRITNAYSSALYKTEASSKTSPNSGDVNTDANKKRLLNDVHGAPLVVSLSPSANQLTSYLRDNGAIVLDVGVHPGQQTTNGPASNYKTYNGLTLKSADDYVKGPRSKEIADTAGGKGKLGPLLSQMRYHTFAKTEIFNRLTNAEAFNHLTTVAGIPTDRMLPEACKNCLEFHRQWTKNWETIDMLLPLLGKVSKDSF